MRPTCGIEDRAPLAERDGAPGQEGDRSRLDVYRVPTPPTPRHVAARRHIRRRGARMSAAQSLFCIVKKPLGGHMKAAVSRKRPRGAMGSGTRVLGATATSPRREVKEVGDAVRGLQV